MSYQYERKISPLDKAPPVDSNDAKSTIVIHQSVKQYLKSKRIFKMETYEEIIIRMIRAYEQLK